MSQLILTVISIALVGLLGLASLNYLPWWGATAALTEDVAKSSFRRVEQAYDVYTRLHDGVAPAVLAQVDGGFSEHFTPILTHLPAALPGFTWSYGQAGGQDYFCMQGSGSSLNPGVLKGLARVKAVFSPTQLFVDSSCGATADGTGALTGSGPVAVTLFVKFVPGVSR